MNPFGWSRLEQAIIGSTPPPTLFPGRFSLALEVGREKALALAGRSVILIG